MPLKASALSMRWSRCDPMLSLVFSDDLLLGFVWLYPYSRCLVTVGSHRVVLRLNLLESSANFRQACMEHTYQPPAVFETYEGECAYLD
jgi:hypothetical protein